MADPAPLFDPTPALAFLEALGKDPATTCFRALHASRKRGAVNVTGWDPARLEQLQQQGYRLYVVVNNGGHNSEQIVLCPALFNEWDDKPLQWQVNAWKELELPEPSLMVATGGKSIHAYWILRAPVAPELWAPIQARLIAHCGGDAACKDAPRLMRLPGSSYLQPDGTVSGRAEIVHQSAHRYGLMDLDLALPEVEPEPLLAPNPARAGSGIPLTDPRPTLGPPPPRSMEEIRAALAKIPEILPDNGQREEFRTLAWGLLCAVREAGAGDAVALALLQEHSPRVTDAAQYLRTDPHSITARSFWDMARKARYDLSLKPARPAPPPTTTDSNTDPNRPPPLGFAELLALTLEAVRKRDTDAEMTTRAEIMARYKRTDAQVSAALFKLLTEQEATTTPERAPRRGIDLSRCEALRWLQPGFIPDSDQTLLYGPAGSGKTTAALRLAFSLIDGDSFLDGDEPTRTGRVLFIASDSGPEPLRQALEDAHLADHPAVTDGRFTVWAHSAQQGQTAWDASLTGCIELLEEVRRGDVALVEIDSAKAVTSRADLNYLDNTQTTAILTFFKYVICPHAAVLWLHHDGTDRGAAAGAKAWREIPSAVHRIEQPFEQGEPDETGNAPPPRPKADRRIWHVVKTRKGSTRSIPYMLDPTGDLVPAADLQPIRNSHDTILRILTDLARNGITSATTRELIDTARQGWGFSSKAIRNALSRAVGARPPEVVRAGHGRYALAPRLLERLTDDPLIASTLDRDLSAENTVRERDLKDPSKVPEGLSSHQSKSLQSPSSEARDNADPFGGRGSQGNGPSGGRKPLGPRPPEPSRHAWDCYDEITPPPPAPTDPYIPGGDDPWWPARAA